jgi:hypothetical protein
LKQRLECSLDLTLETNNSSDSIDDTITVEDGVDFDEGDDDSDEEIVEIWDQMREGTILALALPFYLLLLVYPSLRAPLLFHSFSPFNLSYCSCLYYLTFVICLLKSN